jgi:hypothetical protein
VQKPPVQKPAAPKPVPNGGQDAPPKESSKSAPKESDAEEAPSKKSDEALEKLKLNRKAKDLVLVPKDEDDDKPQESKSGEGGNPRNDVDYGGWSGSGDKGPKVN